MSHFQPAFLLQQQHSWMKRIRDSFESGGQAVQRLQHSQNTTAAVAGAARCAARRKKKRSSVRTAVRRSQHARASLDAQLGPFSNCTQPQPPSSSTRQPEQNKKTTGSGAQPFLEKTKNTHLVKAPAAFPRQAAAAKQPR
jgi:hypothetical protein